MSLSKKMIAAACKRKTRRPACRKKKRPKKKCPPKRRPKKEQQYIKVCTTTKKPHNPADAKAHREIPVFVIIYKNRKADKYPYMVLRVMGKYYTSRLRQLNCQFRKMQVVYAVQCVPQNTDLRCKVKLLPYLDFQGQNFRFKGGDDCRKLVKDIKDIIECIRASSKCLKKSCINE